MPMKNWVTHRFRPDGGDQSDGDSDPVYEEVTNTNGLPVQVVGGSLPFAVPSYSFLALTADDQVKAGAGVLHTVTLHSDAAATAGTIIIYDSLTEAGTIIDSIQIPAAAVPPVTLTYDAAFSNGLYIGFTTTADVDVTVTYR